MPKDSSASASPKFTPTRDAGPGTVCPLGPTRDLLTPVYYCGCCESGSVVRCWRVGRSLSSEDGSDDGVEVVLPPVDVPLGSLGEVLPPLFCVVRLRSVGLFGFESFTLMFASISCRRAFTVSNSEVVTMY